MTTRVWLQSGYQKLPNRKTFSTTREQHRVVLDDRKDEARDPRWIVALPTTRVACPDTKASGLWVCNSKDVQLPKSWQVVRGTKHKTLGIESLIPNHDFVVFDWRQECCVFLDIELIAALNEYKPRILVITPTFDYPGILAFFGIPTTCQPDFVVYRRGVMHGHTSLIRDAKTIGISDETAFINMVCQLDAGIAKAARIWWRDLEHDWKLFGEKKLILVGTQRAATILKTWTQTHKRPDWVLGGNKSIRILSSVEDISWYRKASSITMPVLIVPMDVVGSTQSIMDELGRGVRGICTTLLFQPPTTQPGVLAWKTIRKLSYTVIRVSWSLWMDLFFRWRRSNTGCSGALDLFNRLTKESET